MPHDRTLISGATQLRRNKSALISIAVIALATSSGMALANNGIDSASGINLPISAGGILAMNIRAADGSVQFTGGAPQLPSNSTAINCASANAGALRWNSTKKVAEVCNGTAWGSLGITSCYENNATRSNTDPDNMYPAFAYCSAATDIVTGGGCLTGTAGVDNPTDTYPIMGANGNTPNGWACLGNDSSMTAYVICCH